MTRPKMCDDPLAVTSAGIVLVNAAHLDQNHELHALLEVARAMGRKVFVGVELRPGETREALTKLDQMGAEIVATVYRERG